MKRFYSLILMSLFSGYLVAQDITLLTEPLENRIKDIVVYGQVTGNELPENIALKINEEIYTVAVNDTGLFMQPYALKEGINEVDVAFTTNGLDNPTDKQKISFIDYKLPHVTIDGSVSETTINLTANGTSPVGSGLNYTWTVGENNPERINLSSTTGTSVSFQKPSAKGEYYIYCTATDEDDRRFKAGRFLRIGEDDYYLNNEEMHAAWVDSIMMYEYQLFRFNYDQKLPFLRIAEKFNHIRDLGANAVWHTPPTLGGGGNYFPNNYYLIDPEYGTNADYKQFVERAHAAGLKVIFDIPVGHTNSNHYFLNNVYALKENSPYKDYYLWAGEAGNSAVTYSPENGPNCVYTNVGNDEFKEYLLRVLEYWVREYAIDGYRYDCGQEIYNRDGSFLQEAQRRLRNIKPDIALFIEGSYHENPDYLSVADVCYDWLLHGWGTLNGFKGIFEQNITPDQFHTDFMQSFADRTLPLRYCNTGYFNPVHQTYGWEQEKTGHIIAFTGFGSSLIYAGTETGSDAGQINWNANPGMYPFMRKLVKVKQDLLGSYPEMTRLSNSVPDKVYSYLSKNSENRIVVVANLNPVTQKFTLNLDVAEVNGLSAYLFQDLLNNTVIEISANRIDQVEVSLNPWETKMFWVGESAIEFDKEVSSIKVINTDLLIDEHQGALQLDYEVLPADASDKRVTWSVSDEELATVSESGLIRATGMKNGDLQVTATAFDGSDVQKEITVNISNQEEYHNFIKNPDFDEYFDYWRLTHYSGLVEINVENYQAEMNISEVATNQWDIQLMQPFILLEPNTRYLLSFDAKSSVEQNILVSLTDVIWQSALITNEWKPILIPFTTANNTEFLFSLMLGDNIGELSFDNFSISKEESTELVDITFRVDMQNEDVSESGVFLRGTFNNWNSTISMQNDGTVYSETLELTPGTEIEYKFVNGDNWESSIPNDCGTGDNNNRYFTVPETDTSIDVVCFNSCEACSSTSIEEQPGSEIGLFPNPAENSFKITNLPIDDHVSIKMYNVHGQLIKEVSASNQTSVQIELEDVVDGIYFINIHGNDLHKTLKIIKEDNR